MDHKCRQEEIIKELINKITHLTIKSEVHDEKMSQFKYEILDLKKSLTDGLDDIKHLLEKYKNDGKKENSKIFIGVITMLTGVIITLTVFIITGN